MYRKTTNEQKYLKLTEILEEEREEEKKTNYETGGERQKNKEKEEKKKMYDNPLELYISSNKRQQMEYCRHVYIN